MIMIQLKLDRILQEKQISRYQLAKSSSIQYHIIDNYYKNKVKRYDSYILNRICEVLNCDICDLIEYRKDE